MGIDFLDMTFRLEKKFACRIHHTVWKEAIDRRGGIRELTAGDVCDVIQTYIPALQARRRSVEEDMKGHSRVIEYAASAEGWFNFTGDPWPLVQEIIAATLSVPVDRVQPSSRLVLDLGMC